jgi:hypothetical protein
VAVSSTVAAGSYQLILSGVGDKVTQGTTVMLVVTKPKPIFALCRQHGCDAHARQDYSFHHRERGDRRGRG